MIRYLLSSVLMLSYAHAFAAIVEFKQTLSDAIVFTTENSSLLKSVRASEEANAFHAKASEANLLPNLSLQGNYFYQTNVPSLSLGPLNANFGTHNNYSVGPALSYTVFDGGKDRDSYASATLLARSAEQNKKSQEASLELGTRQTYFRVQYGLRQLELTVDSLRLSLAQDKDIEMRYKAGAASRLDEVQAKRDVLSYQLKFRQAQADLAGSFRDLLALEGNTQVLDTSCPVSPAVEEKLPQGIEVPTVRIDLDSLEGSLSALSAKDSEFSFSGLNHPEVMSLQSQADASRHLAESERGALFPRIVLQAKAYYEYPNVVLPESVWQETLGASLTFPLFEGDLSRSLANEDLKNAASNDFKHEQKLTDLSRDEDKAKDALISLQAQKVICGENINEAQEVERLTYQSYRAGKSRLLDVQDANLKLLEAQVSAAQIDSEILNEMAILAYLSSK